MRSRYWRRCDMGEVIRKAASLVGPAMVLGAFVPLAQADFEKGPYLQNLRKDGVVVMWQSAQTQPGVVRVTVGAEEKVIEAPAERVHEVRVDGLSPGSQYSYTVTSGEESRSGVFATAPALGDTFSFVVYGDSRSNRGAHTRVVERVRSEVPDFLLSTGDLVNEGSSAADWQTFFDIEGLLLKDNVLFPSLGNHDRQGRGKTADNYRTYFSVPENSPNPERYYAFTYGNSRFLILDSNSHSFSLTDQTAWIEEQLQVAHRDPKVQHIFVTMHHPPYSVSLHGGQTELREAWTPLFERYGVKAVFSGHDHVYSRAERNGVRYFVSGGGGAPLYPRKHRKGSLDERATQNFERVNHYLRVHVVERLVEITAVRVDGSVIETVTFGTPREVIPLASAKPAASRASAVGGAELEGAPARAIAMGQVKAERKSGRGRPGHLSLLGFAAVAVAGLGLAWSFLRG